MKARMPKNPKQNPKSRSMIYYTQNKLYVDPNRSLSVIRQDIENVYNELIKTTSSEDLGIDISSIKDASYFDLQSTRIICLIYALYENIDSFRISSLYKNTARTYILDLLKNKLTELLDNQCKLPENENLIYEITDSDFQNSISKSTFPQCIKTTVLNTYNNYSQTNRYIPQEIVSDEETSQTLSEEDEVFYDEVKKFTNNFKFLFVSEVMHLEKHYFGKFSNYENFLKYDTFQRKLKEFKNKKHMSELTVIKTMLDSKRLSPVYQKILSSREEVISKEIENSL